jgi:Ni/Co efflux regulator RcnB
MKRLLLAIILLAVCITVFAQQSGERPTSAQTKESAARLLEQSRTNASQFESTQADLSARNNGNNDTAVFNQLKADIERLESSITTEQGRIRASLDAGARVSPELFQRVQRLINQHKQKMAELEAFSRTR